MRKPKHEYPFTSMRLWKDHLDPHVFESNLALMRKYPGACDEVWFASDYGFPPVAVHQDHARQMAGAAAKVRAVGIIASLQISNTIGHGEYLRHLDFRGLTDRMVGADGTVAPYCACPRSPKHLAYLDATVRAYCAWEPDCIWIDDDLRMTGHAPVNEGCFCDLCLAEFAKAAGVTMTRESLVKAITVDNDLVTRAAWLQFCRNSAAGVARTVARAAVAVAPKCRLGFQGCSPTGGGASGPDWRHVFDALHEVTGRPVGSRPGGGFYTDHQPRQMIEKAVYTGLQNARLPDYIAPVSYECENLPGSVMGKSATGTVLECTLAISQGCRSLSFTHLMFPYETDWHATMTATIEAWRPFWEAYVAANADTANTGVDVVFGRNHFMRRLNPGEAPFAWSYTWFGNLMPAAVLGLPLCWNEQAPAAWLTGPAAQGVDEADLRKLMTRGLLLDGEALEVLEQRSLAPMLGLRFKPVAHPFDRFRFEEDPLNGIHSGRTMMGDCFAFGKSRSVEVTQGRSRCLSRYTHLDGTPADMETVAVEHDDGRRVVVFGSGAGISPVTTSRRHQILSAADWVCHGQLPVWLETPGQVVVVPRCDNRGQVATVLLLNASLDPTSPLRLRVKGGNNGWKWMRPLKRDIALPPGDTVTLPSLPAWGLGVLRGC